MAPPDRLVLLQVVRRAAPSHEVAITAAMSTRAV